MDLVTSGNAELDLVLGGGFTPGSLVVVAGSPGTGKTILAQQLVFANATEDRPGLYYTTLSEPHSKLIKHLEPFDFFQREALGSSVNFLHITEILQGIGSGERGVQALVDEVVGQAFDRSPSFVVIDSSKALHHFADADRLRETVFSLASTVSHTGAVLVLVGEYTADELDTSPEFAVADGIIHLGVSRRGPSERRWLRVVKLRGRAYLSGEHTFRIGSSGYDLYPRLETVAPSGSPPLDGRHAFGIDMIDGMTHGGIPAGQGTLLMGPSGCGKTLLGLQWTAAGLRAGERCLYVSLEETRDELVGKSQAFGFGLADAEERGDLEIVFVPPMELEVDQLGGELQDRIERLRPDRIVLDGLAEVNVGARRADRFPSYLWALTATLRARGASVVFTYEVAAIGGVTKLDALSYLFHNVIVLRYMERGSELGRVLNVLKMRSSGHAKGLLQFEVSDQGIETVGEPGEVSATLGWTVIGTPTGD